jgi:hypothetical protein
MASHADEVAGFPDGMAGMSEDVTAMTAPADDTADRRQASRHWLATCHCLLFKQVRVEEDNAKHQHDKPSPPPPGRVACVYRVRGVLPPDF